MRRFYSLRAFTLIELLIVIAIIAILALIAVPNFMEAQVRAKVSRVHADMRSIATALESYMVDYNTYPMKTQKKGKDAGASDPTNDPWAYYDYLDMSCTTGVWDGFMGLTTPIAYITRCPPDPFADANAFSGGRHPSMTDTFGCHDVSYLFANYHGWHLEIEQDSTWVDAQDPNDRPTPETTPVGITSPAPLIFSGKTYSSVWSMMSTGPDRVGFVSGLQDNHCLYPLSTVSCWRNLTSEGSCPLYDPTNGTVSVGDIWRLSAGSPHDK